MMEYNRRIVPPTLGRPRARAHQTQSLREFDEMWTGIQRKPGPPKPKTASSKPPTYYPPARSDAEIRAIVDEFIDELAEYVPYYDAETSPGY